MPDSLHDRYHYVVSDYYATGEGRTISILITEPRFITNDYEVEPRYDFKARRYIPGILKPGITAKVVVARQFIELFGHMAYGAENLDREAFVRLHGSLVPAHILRMTDPNSMYTMPGAFHYHAQVYFNFS